jgi:hypothetical protein
MLAHFRWFSSVRWCSNGPSAVEGDASGVDRDVLLLVHVVHDFFGLGLEVEPVVPAIRVELQVRGVENGLTAKLIVCLHSLGQLQGVQGNRIVTRVAQAVLVDVNGVRKSQVLVCFH